MSLNAAEKFEIIRLETLERHQNLTHKADQDRLEELRGKKSDKPTKPSEKKAPAKKAVTTKGKK